MRVVVVGGSGNLGSALLHAISRTADIDAVGVWLLQPSHDVAQLARTNVDGSQRVFDAAVAAGVPHLVCMSSVGTYSPGLTDRPVDESWPVDGVPSST